jgi:transcriptional regulator with XRE-family HTH domain
MVFVAVDGPFLRDERKSRGWTVEAFATQVGISRQYLTDIESGRRLLKRRPDLIKKMADVLIRPVPDHRLHGHRSD